MDLVWYIVYYNSAIPDQYKQDIEKWCGVHGYYIIRGVMASLRPTIMSYSVYLMQRHNSNEYASFLKVITMCKLHYCCCWYRCRGTVMEQIKYFNQKGEDPCVVKMKLLAAPEMTEELLTCTAYN